MDLQETDRAAVIAAAGAIAKGDDDTSTNSCIQLYSIVPHALSARCKVWKGTLNLAHKWQQLCKGYFDAPGEAAAAGGDAQCMYTV